MTVGRVQVLLVLLGVLAACTPAEPEAVDLERLREDVFATEQAFARTLAERDVVAFASFLSPEAVFFTGDSALRGSTAVVELWSRYFEGDEAPFSWAPETVEVLDSGTLALSSGPVYGADGSVIATFNSIWRRDDDGRWRIVFDKGSSVACECE